MAKVDKSDCERTLTRASGNDKVAPVPAIRGTEIERQGSTRIGRCLAMGNGVRPFRVLSVALLYTDKLSLKAAVIAVTTGSICLRTPAHGGLYAWEFEKDGREPKVRVEGPRAFNGTTQMLNAALAGLGVAYMPEQLAQPRLAEGRFERVRRGLVPGAFGQQSWPALALLVDVLRYRG
jgi:hypothetical protein